MQWRALQQTVALPPCTVLQAFAFSLPFVLLQPPHAGMQLYPDLKRSQTVCVGDHVASSAGCLFEVRLQVPELTHYVGVLVQIMFLHVNSLFGHIHIFYGLKIHISWLETRLKSLHSVLQHEKYVYTLKNNKLVQSKYNLTLPFCILFIFDHRHFSFHGRDAWDEMCSWIMNCGVKWSKLQLRPTRTIFFTFCVHPTSS